MTFTLKLSKPSVQELHQAIHHARLLGELKTVQRCSALLFLDAGNDQSTVASCLNVSIRAVQRWVGAFVGGGVGALHVKKPSGRPPKLTPSQKKQLKAHLQKGPEAWGYATGVWTSALIQDHLATTFQVSYSVFYISQLLRNLGMSFIKPKTYYAQDPDDMKKQLSWIREEYPALYKEVLEKHGVLFFQDESGFQLQSNAVRTRPSKNAVFGLNSRTDPWTQTFFPEVPVLIGFFIQIRRSKKWVMLLGRFGRPSIHQTL
jgi:transposase